MKVLMSGGGTAGHVYPALTVAALLADEHDEVTFVGTPDGLEARLVPEAGFDFVSLPATGFDRSRPWTLVTSSVRIAVSAIRAWWRMGADRPDVVLGFGGFVSIPVGLAAVWRGVPLVLHEQNSVPGLANRVLSRWANAAALTYEESAAGLVRPDRTEVTGNPVRSEVLRATRARGREALDVGEKETLLLVFGGSRGARHINSAMVGLAARVMSMQGVRVVHVTGPGEHQTVTSALVDSKVPLGRWRAVPYLDGMGDAIAAADLVVARAGATSLAEIMALGVASVLVPYPYATDDHQTKNAATLVAHGAAVLFADSEIDDERFGDAIVELLGDPERRDTMSAASRALGRRDAAERVVAVMKRAAGADRESAVTRTNTEDSVV